MLNWKSWTAGVLGAFLSMQGSPVQAREGMVGNGSPAPGRLSSSVFYGQGKYTDDFSSRGEVKTSVQSVGGRLGYGLTERDILSISGGSYVDPEVEAQGSTWRGRSGFWYGLDFSHDLFPQSDWKPGLQFQAGVFGYQIPLDRLESASGLTSLIDQRMSGVEYHGAVLAAWKFGRFSPYGGIRMYGSSVAWRDNQPAGATAERIVGHASGNVSLIAGCPVRLTPEWRLQAEGRFVNETSISVGLQYLVN